MKQATKKEKEHMAAVKTLPCVICGTYGVDCHHICDTGRRLGHFYTLPLCKKCHTGRDGFSGLNRGAWDKSLRHQIDLCKETHRKLGTEMPPLTLKVNYAGI